MLLPLLLLVACPGVHASDGLGGFQVWEVVLASASLAAAIGLFSYAVWSRRRRTVVSASDPPAAPAPKPVDPTAAKPADPTTAKPADSTLAKPATAKPATAKPADPATADPATAKPADPTAPKPTPPPPPPTVRRQIMQMSQLVCHVDPGMRRV